MQPAPHPTGDPAVIYESYQVPALFGPFAIELVARAAPRPGERVLDLACGTGVVARRIAPLVAPGGRVDALDVNPAMLRVARGIAGDEGVAITFHQGDMAALPFANDAYDLVTCQQGLQFVPDPAAAVREMRRVIHAGGRAIVSCWSAVERNPLYATMAPVVARHVGVPALNDPFRLANADELRSLFTAAGFTDVQVEAVHLVARYPQPDRFATLLITSTVASIPAMQQAIPAARERLIAALSRDLEPVLREFIVGDDVHSPRETLVVRARMTDPNDRPHPAALRGMLSRTVDRAQHTGQAGGDRRG